MAKEKPSLGISSKTMLAVIAALSVIPYDKLPKPLQDLKNVVDSVNPLKRLFDWISSMTEAEALFKLHAGDHIYCYRKGYSHHGIYAGDGMVWEYDGTDIHDAHVQYSTITNFAMGDRINRLNYKPDFPPDIILQRAASRVFCGDYDLLRNNCLHYALWCRLSSKEDVCKTGDVIGLLLPERMDTN